MILDKTHRSDPAEHAQDFDDLMANLFVLITHHSLTQCQASLSHIVERLNRLCHHPDIELYPKQLKVLIKMRQLWRTHLFKQDHGRFPH